MATLLRSVRAREREAPADAPRARREELAVAFFGSWAIAGLYLDGWAHTADKPESFFTPWHAVLYSGVGAAVLWFGIEGVRTSGSVSREVLSPADRLAGLGLVLFTIGAVGDGFWHEIFGVEVDLEALLSPTHLLLLIGGFLMLSAPARAALADPAEAAASFRSFLPVAVSVTLAAGLTSFFTMYLSAFRGVGTYWVDGGHDVRELVEVEGVGSILVTNAILLGALVLLMRRWRPPFGTFTLMFTALGFAMTGVDGFRAVELALPALLGGLLADVLVTRGLPARAVAGLVPLVMWSAFFGVVHASAGLEWSAELVSGSVVLAVASGVLLATLVAPRSEPPAPAPSLPVL